MNALLVAVELLRAGELFRVTAASTRFRHDLQALTAAIDMASHVAKVRLAIQLLAACITASWHLLPFAGNLVSFFSTGAGSVLFQGTVAAIAGYMASALAAMYVTGVFSVAKFLANPRALVALPYLFVTLTTAFQ